MANKFSQEDIDLIKRARFLLDDRIRWANDPGGGEARDAYNAINHFLNSPAANYSSFCPNCSQRLPDK